MAALANPLATPAQMRRCLALSPLPAELMDAVFVATQRLTQAAGLLLELPQSTTACANVLLARYWLADPGFGGAGDAREAPAAADEVDYEYSHVSAAALFLVAKTGEFARSARDVANVYAYLATHIWGGPDDTNASSHFDESSYLDDTGYVAFHSHVLALEARILYMLSFDTHVALPHPLAITYLQALDFFGLPKGKEAGTTPTSTSLAARTIHYLNTSLLSPQLLYVTHQPHELAVAAIYNAARDGGCAMPPDVAWWEVFDVDRETLGFLVVAQRSVATWVQAARQTPSGRTLLGAGTPMPTRQRVALAKAQLDREASEAGPGGESVAATL